MHPQSDPNAETVIKGSSSDPNQPSVENDGRPAVQSRANLIGTTLGGRYVVERELGRGGMGALYLARDKPELHSRPVVVKVLLEDAMKHDWVVAKFHQEIESLTRLDDPGVVGVFDAGKLEDGTPYLVMQFVEGTTMRVAMKPEGMNLEQVAGIIRQVGRSIAAAHEVGILHRDLKPENIMLRQIKSGEQQVKIIDFGIAKIKNSITGPSPVTGMTVGTIGYMSPEQLSAKHLTPASDIYSLGVIAYEMITGRKPFTPDSMFQLLEMQRDGVRVKPCDLRPNLPESAQELLLKALAFDPNERFQSAIDFGDQLASTLTHEDKASERTTKKLATRAAAALPENEAAQSQQKIETGSFKPTLEMAHVLFMDIVSYSKLLTDEQPARLRELQDIVRGTAEFQKAQRLNQLVRLPTGDGMALSFFGDLEAPVRCAVEIGKALTTHPDLKLRMGVHSGLVYRIADINENLNVSGGGINVAQRVMDCGDAGHILVSKRVADDLQQLSRWANELHDLGEAEVKHGLRVHIYSLYNAEVGNAEMPARLRASPAKSRPINHRLAMATAAALVLVLLSAVSFFLLKSALTPTRSLAYSLTVQKMAGDQKIGDEYESTGKDRYGNSWRYRMNVTAGEPGYLYMLNEGTVNYNVLFPTEPNDDHLAANQRMQTVWYFFDNNPGIERVWIIFSARPISELDTIVKDATKDASKGIITIADQAQIKTVRDIIAQHSTTDPIVDESKKQSVVKGSGNILVSLLELQHKTP